MIGIGISTTDKRIVSRNIYKYAPSDSRIEIYNDVERKGISRSRNSLLSRLQDCDDIFLFDDDCYPVMFGQAEYFIDQCKKHSVDFCQIPEVFKTKLLSVSDEMGEQDGSIGCFTYITKKGLQTIGGFRTEYTGYGFEDAEYKFRAIKAGLTKGLIKAPIRSYAYIHSEDVFGENPTPNFSFDEKNRFIDLNSKSYLNDLKSGLIYYEYRT